MDRLSSYAYNTNVSFIECKNELSDIGKYVKEKDMYLQEENYYYSLIKNN